MNHRYWLLGAALFLLGGSKPPQAASWIAAHCEAADGMLTVRPGGIYVSGYFGNITALGLVASGSHGGIVERWMRWYIDHAHGSGSGVDGVPDDGRLVRGLFVSRGRPDSTDAYGATFVTLAYAAYRSGNPQLRALVLTHRRDLGRIAASMLATLQPNGLTFARPQHHVAYAIDNEQVYRGLLDAAGLWREAYHDDAASERFAAQARATLAGIQRVLWDPQGQTYRPHVNALGIGPPADLTHAYPDALAQALAIVYGVVDPRSLLASTLLDRADAALLVPAAGDVGEYRQVVRLALELAGKPAPPQDFSAPPVCADAGWFLLAQAAAVP